MLSEKTSIVMQYFDAEWDAYVDIEDITTVPNKAKVKCTVCQCDNVSGIYVNSY